MIDFVDYELTKDKNINILEKCIYKSKNIFVFSFYVLFYGRKEFFGLNDLLIKFVVIIEHFLGLPVQFYPYFLITCSQ